MTDTDKMAEIRGIIIHRYILSISVPMAINAFLWQIFWPNILNSQKLSLILCPLFPERNVNFFKTI